LRISSGFNNITSIGLNYILETLLKNTTLKGNKRYCYDVSEKVIIWISLCLL